MVVLKTITGRSTVVTAPATYSKLLQAAVKSLKLEQGTVRLLFRGEALSPHHDVDDEAGASEALSKIGVSDNSEIIAVGMKSSFKSHHTPLTAPPQHTTPARSPMVKTPASPVIVAGPLSFPHVPDGLIEFVSGMKPLADDHARFRYMSQHVTIQAIRDIVKKDVKMLEEVLKQANEVHRPFVDTINENMGLFLDVINGKQRKYIQDLFNPQPGEDGQISERDALAQAGLQMFEALGNLLGVGTEIEAEVTFEEGTPTSLDAMPFSDTLPTDQILNDLEQANAEEDHITAAMCCMRLAQIEREKETVDKELVSSYYNDAVDNALLMTHIALHDVTGFAIGAVSSVGPQIFVAAQLWFMEKGDCRRSLEVCIAHFCFWEAIEKENANLAEKSPAEAVDEMLAHCKDQGDFTIVLYSLLKDEAMYLTYVINKSGVQIRATPYVHDAFRSSLSFMEGSVQKLTSGVNASMVWAERLASMYGAFIEPIEDLLPKRPKDLFADAGHVCFLLTMTKVVLPFHAMMDKNGIPAIAKWEISQCQNYDVFLESAAKASNTTPTSLAAPSTVVSDVKPAWYTNTVRRCLNMDVAPSVAQGSNCVLHLTDSSRQAIKAPTELLVCEKFSKQLIESLVHARVPGFVRCIETPVETPYELMRHFYRKLCTSGSVATAAREAMLRCSESSPDTLWQWASFAVLNFGGPIEVLKQRAQTTSQVAARQSQRRRVLRASSEGQYAEQHAIGELYDEMVHDLLREKPDSETEVLDAMIHFLERNQSRLEDATSGHAMMERMISTEAPAASPAPAPAPAPGPAPVPVAMPHASPDTDTREPVKKE